MLAKGIDARGVSKKLHFAATETDALAAYKVNPIYTEQSLASLGLVL